jgi:hypothetical protein
MATIRSSLGLFIVLALNVWASVIPPLAEHHVARAPAGSKAVIVQVGIASCSMHDAHGTTDVRVVVGLNCSRMHCVLRTCWVTNDWSSGDCHF